MQLDALRRAYDAIADDYARLVPDLSLEAPLDRAVLSAFVEMVEPGALVADVGCGTGRLAQHLRGAGVRAVGFDLSPRMLTVARDQGLPAAAAHAGALPLREGAVGGLVAWYSLIHLPPDVLPAVCAELARVVCTGGPVVVAFQCGTGERVDRSTSYRRPVPLTYYRHRPADVAEALEAGGFSPYAAVERAPVLAFESTPQAFLVMTRT